MKVLKTLFFLILSNVCFGQIIEIIEMPQYTKESAEATNKLRISLGLNELKDDATLDSAAKHHAYYVVYSFLYTPHGGNHFETIDIPNFQEKLRPRDRAGNDVNEIQFASFTGNSKTDLNESSINMFAKSHYMEGYSSFGEAYIGNYKTSPAHYRIMTKKGIDLFGTFTLIAKIKTSEYEMPIILIVTVTDSRPIEYKMSTY